MISSGLRKRPDSIRSVHLRSGSRRAKMTHKKFFLEISCSGYSLLRAEGFSYSLDVLYGGLGIIKLQF
jgi:hypothetical protein